MLIILTQGCDFQTVIICENESIRYTQNRFGVSCLRAGLLKPLA